MKHVIKFISIFSLMLCSASAYGMMKSLKTAFVEKSRFYDKLYQILSTPKAKLRSIHSCPPEAPAFLMQNTAAIVPESITSQQPIVIIQEKTNQTAPAAARAVETKKASGISARIAGLQNATSKIAPSVSVQKPNSSATPKSNSIAARQASLGLGAIIDKQPSPTRGMTSSARKAEQENTQPVALPVVSVSSVESNKKNIVKKVSPSHKRKSPTSKPFVNPNAK